MPKIQQQPRLLDTYLCSAVNILERNERKAAIVVVSLPRFTTKPPMRVAARAGDNLTLNCSATGDPQPVISWRKEGGQLPVGRSQQNGGALVIRAITMNETGNYVCVATNAGMFDVETVTNIDVQNPSGTLPQFTHCLYNVHNEMRNHNET